MNTLKATTSAEGTTGPPEPVDSTRQLLLVENLSTRFDTVYGETVIVDGVSLSIAAGETVGIVGESGSGKSVLVRSLMGLFAEMPGVTVSGQIHFDGRDISRLSPAGWRRVWGAEIAMIFQDPMTSLNPVRTIGAHLVVPLRQHLGLGRRAAADRSVELLAEVGIPEPKRRAAQFPHELSGGMRQRVGVALALSCQPKLLIADEPTTALDVTVQRQILELIDSVAENTGMATILITHDLGVVASRADRIAVMYAGRIVEQADARALFHSTGHPYTEALLASVPRLSHEPHTRRTSIPGHPPDLINRVLGCSFAARCPQADGRRCLTDVPVLRDRSDARDSNHEVACHHPRNMMHTVTDTTSPSGGRG